MQHLIEQLNPPQQEAVLTTEGPLLIIAGAGSGKTRTITHRIAYLMREKHVQPSEIFAATFTNKAAAEMKERVRDLLGYGRLPWMSISTFHSICVQILRQEATHLGFSPNFMIADDRDAQTLMNEVLKDMGIGRDLLHPKQALWMIGQLKIRMLPMEDAAKVMEDHLMEMESALEMGTAEVPASSAGNLDLADLIVDAATTYQRRLRANDAVDFDDLILYTTQLWEEHPDVLKHYQDRYRYLLVDEYQDTNMAQFRLVELLASRDRNICVVGDEDQSIYSWRGADMSNLLDFQKVYPDAKLIKLEQNYRSTGNVLAAASQVIARNKERIGKTLWTDIGDGLPIIYNPASSDLQEAEMAAQLIENVVRETSYSYGDCAIFYRVKTLSRVIEEAMRRFDIPYVIVGGTGFYDRLEIRDLMAYLQLAINPHQTISLLRVINTPRRGVGQKTLDQLMQQANRENKSLYQAIIEALEAGVLKGRSAKLLPEFSWQLGEWQKIAANSPPPDVLKRLLDDTGYRAHLGNPNHLDVRARLENIEQLIAALETFHVARPAATLGDWLEETALASDQDDLAENPDRVALMTLHAAKGLEFPVVIMTGIEEPIFPNRRAAEERGNDEEERRLYYVGITRAKRLLVLSNAESRMMHGEIRFNPPSPFLYEVPQELMADVYDIDLRDIDDVSQGRRGSSEALLEAERKMLEEQEQRASGTFQEDRVRSVMASQNKRGTKFPTYEDFARTDISREESQEEWQPSQDAVPGPHQGKRLRKKSRFAPAQPTLGADLFPSEPSASSSRKSTQTERSSVPKPKKMSEATPLAWVRLGDRVGHDLLGEGRVIGISGKGQDRKFLIQFEDGDEREMLAAYANLTRLDP